MGDDFHAELELMHYGAEKPLRTKKCMNMVTRPLNDYIRYFSIFLSPANLSGLFSRSYPRHGKLSVRRLSDISIFSFSNHPHTNALTCLRRLRHKMISRDIHIALSNGVHQLQLEPAEQRRKHMIDICKCETAANTSSQSHGPDLIPEQWKDGKRERKGGEKRVSMCAYGYLNEVHNGKPEYPLTGFRCTFSALC